MSSSVPHRLLGLIGGLSLLAALTGCRAIGRFGESRQSIAARQLSRQGTKAMHQGDWRSAEDLFTDALQVSDRDDRAHWGLAESLWQRERRAEAIAHMEKAVELSAADPVLVGRLGRMYLDDGRVEDALQQSRLAIQADRYSAEIWTLYGDCLMRLERLEEGLAAYHRALANQPDYTPAQLQAAVIYHRQGRFDRLLATLDRVQDQAGAADCPAQVDLLRGIAMRNLGRPEEAKRCFVRAAGKLPDDSSPHLQIASLSLQEGDVTTARDALATALRLDPKLAADDDAMQEFRDPRYAQVDSYTPPPKLR